ncbi:MAG: oxygen-independent coproporphyrinogen III oxidase, partial [Marinilabiliales bacterium]|nr:oxygen-independent coproporphyrinogen III oxidase [Marinilabiliales bacterium]
MKYNVSGPRYTSYPPANFFHDGFTAEDFVQEIKASNKQEPANISLYIHIPFCPQRCHFCGCSTVIAQRRKVVERYVAALKTEIAGVAKMVDSDRVVTQIHWGGGTPNSISMSFIREIMDWIYSHFTMAPKAEIAMECSPAYLEFQHIDALAEMGFNRISLGIQDFREDVLKVVNREPSRHPVKDLVDYLRTKGFKGINLDFIYGLPMQTLESFHQTIEQAIAIRPDRIVTFSYAHVPWVKAAQKQLEVIGLPDADLKMKMFLQATAQLKEAGYHALGIDHFTLPDDDLTKAFLGKMLHRNFQGYCTRETTGQVYAFGASSISQLHGAYAQNFKDLTKYMDAIENEGWAIERGYRLNEGEQLVRSVINRIMCNGFLDFAEVAQAFQLTLEEIRDHLQYHPDRFEALAQDGLVVLSGDTLRL